VTILVIKLLNGLKINANSSIVTTYPVVVLYKQLLLLAMNVVVQNLILTKRGRIMEDEKEDPYYQAVSTAIVAIREQICTNNGGQIVYLVVESEDK